MSTGSGGVVAVGTAVGSAGASVVSGNAASVGVAAGACSQDLAQYQKRYYKDHFPVFHLLLLLNF